MTSRNPLPAIASMMFTLLLVGLLLMGTAAIAAAAVAPPPDNRSEAVRPPTMLGLISHLPESP